jgi:hypothetical protein
MTGMKAADCKRMNNLTMTGGDPGPVSASEYNRKAEAAI